MDETATGLSRHDAHTFVQKWQDATSEKSDAQSFWRDFLTNVCGIEDLRQAGIHFEKPVVSALKGTTNFIDVFWQGTALIEHKSAGKDLDEAEKQARDYIVGLPPSQRPPVIIVSDFARIRIVQYLTNETHQFPIANLPDELPRIEAVITQNGKGIGHVEVDADQKATALMGDLFTELERNNYTGHHASVFIIRILFLLFGDDTGMWRRTTNGLFDDFLHDTFDNGRDLGARLQELFQTLDTPKEKRPHNIDDKLGSFPYVNGGLFAEQLPIFTFDAPMRDALLKCSAYSWSDINPIIFGSLFQNIRDKEHRHEKGQHFTSEANILKAIRPLFLDEYLDELEASWDNVSRLKRLRQSLGNKHYLDPACGSGNFLSVSYKQLRDLELNIIARLQVLEGQVGNLQLDGTMGLSVHLKQFSGIEIDDWSAQIARVAMFLTDHQANIALDEITGAAPTRFPLTESANIVEGNALTLDWTTVCPINDDTIILGNPPFLGQHLQDADQKAETRAVWQNHKKTGVMDFVSNWFVLASRYMDGTAARAALVSTNSITQGEQVEPLTAEMRKHGMGIDFAHRTFAWMNDAKGKAAVHCVIIGFSSNPKPKTRPLWTYDTPTSQPELLKAKNINPYLIDAPDTVVGNRGKALSSDFRPMFWGSKPTDGGFLANIKPDEAAEIRSTDPIAAKYLKPLIGSEELINGKERYCLWLDGAEPADLRSSPVLKERVEAVRQMRLASVAPSTRDAATYAHRFRQVAQPTTPYLGVPRVSSENRPYVPLAYFSPEIIASDALLTIPDATVELFAVLTSSAFQAWNSTVSGRLKSDSRISQEITYNNFPLPALTDEQREKLKQTGQAILDTRNNYPNSSLADLYGQNSMPLDLRKAHEANDKAVLRLYGLSGAASQAEILSALFDEYENLTKGLI